MKRGIIIFLILLTSLQLVHSISIKELISRYSFSTVTTQMNVTNHTDFMIDKNNNGVNDTLVLELTTSSTAGNFAFVINLFDKNGVLVNETNKTLNAGTNKINLTFSSTLLSQSQFNYSIKVYNSTRRLKYRKDNILTQSYLDYEEGFRIIDIKDIKVNKTLRINVTLNSPKNETHVTTLFLNYNNSVIFSKETKSIKSGANQLIFNFDNETIKRTHYIGNFTIASLKIGRKTLKVNSATSFYDFKDFAVMSYISSFADNGTDTDNDKKYDSLQINVSTQITKSGNYILILKLYDFFDNLIDIKNTSSFLTVGSKIVSFDINGSEIYGKKLNGPFIIKSIELFDGDILIDQINDAYATGNYNFNDFENPNLPDLKVDISVSDGYHYGIENITINFTFKNIGSKHAFNFFNEIFDNKTFHKSNKTSILNANSEIIYQINFTNISDFEINAIADLQNFIEELNESNNAERTTIRLNKKPNLTFINDITVNETDKIVLNLSASDPNDDKLSFSINLSKFSNAYNIFQWNTSTTDSGNYTLSITASDRFLNDTAIFKIIILDVPEKDVDNDGINDSIDNLIGNENFVNTSTINLTILLDDSGNLSKLFNGSVRVKFMDRNLTIAEFDFNFSLYKLNLTNITINKQIGNSTGFLFVRGLKMPAGTIKTLYIDKINKTINGVCIKEEEILTINEISDNCNSNNEFKVECDGALQNSYSCIYNSTSNKYRVRGLKHSGIVQLEYTKPSESSASTSSGSGSGGGSGGGGGSIVICTSEWKCDEWSQCIDGLKNRKCYDANQCSFPTKKPVEIERCITNEKKIFDIIKPLKYADSTLKKIKQSIPKEFMGITGQAIKSSFNEKLNIGIFIILAEVLMIVGTYLTIKTGFFSKMFK